MAEPASIAAAASGLCPRCGAPGLFGGWVSFTPKCRSCDLEFSTFNVGDGPAAFLILIIGAMLVTAALVVDLNWSPPWWVHAVWAPIGLAMTVYGLRFGKALLLGQEYRYRARDGKIAE